MKNIILIVSLFFNFYFFLGSSSKVDNKEDGSFDEVKVLNSSLSKKDKTHKVKKVEPKLPKASKLSSLKSPPESEKKEKSYKEEKDEEYKNLTLNYKKSFDDFAYTDLRLSESQVIFYEELQNERRREIEEYLGPKFEQMEDKETDYYVYTSEDLIFLGKLNEKYLRELKRDWGENAFSQYQEFLSKFNNSQMNNGQNVKFLIDF